MKRVGNLYSSVYDMKKINAMCDKVCSKVRNKDKVEAFMLYKSEHIVNIYHKLKEKKINASSYHIFFITDPKCRLIMAQNIEDKIINHLVADTFLVDVFDNTFNESVCATRVGKGTLYGINLLKKYINIMKKNHDNFYYLQIDIKKYFYSIDHDILKKTIRKKIKDKDVLMILDEIIVSTDSKYINKKIELLKENRIKFLEKYSFKKEAIDEVKAIPFYEKGMGCSIGNQTSQIFGIIYLNEFNHFLKEKLKLKYVVNYMDDFIILHENKNYLKWCLTKIEVFLKNELKLELNVKKTKIHSIHNVGYRFILDNYKLIVRVGKRGRRNFRKKLKEIDLLEENNLIRKDEVIKNLAGYKGMFYHSSSFFLYQKEIDKRSILSPNKKSITGIENSKY